jgi:lysosomal Pro-X carboxypeptidase
MKLPTWRGALLPSLALLLAAIAPARAARRHSSFSRSAASYASTLSQPRAGPYAYEWDEAYFPAWVDNYNFNANTSQATYQERYLVNNASWGGPGSPIFFYCGNEGFIELFANNTGFLWETAVQFKSLVVFAEHRFYGLSLPFGDASFEIDNLALLSAEQAIADYAWLISSLKANLSATNSPVVLFGGSYGGMLAAWMRIKFPSAAVGAIASSAPILQIPGVMDPAAYMSIVTADFTRANPLALMGVYNTFSAIQDAGATQAGRDEISSTLGLCAPLESLDDAYGVIGWLENAIGFMAMADYPYPANFLGPMPAYPCSVAAEAYTAENGTLTELLTMARNGIAQIFYNFTAQAGSCFNLSSQSPPGLQGDGWGVQCCHEVVQPIGTYGPPSDFFLPSPFNETASIEGCQQSYNGTTPRPTWVQIEYGGWDLDGVSNIFFANGELDPWRSGGITTNLTGTIDVTSFTIAGGAHHLDLRAANAADPDSVRQARELSVEAITRWCKAFYQRRGMEQRV